MNLTVIIPTTREYKSIPTISSAFNQIGFDNVTVVVSGKSTYSADFVKIIKSKFCKKDLFIAKCEDKLIVLPGEARNDALRFIFKNKINSDYILFLDDDVIIPLDYCTKLVDYININDSCAAMGRVSSLPINFWTSVIDYSNFWWLQLDKSIKNMEWLATTATLTRLSYINKVLFREDVAVNEDVIFFNEIKNNTKRNLSICAEVTAEHWHNRKNIKEFLIYQFNNGRKGVLFHKDGISLLGAIDNIKKNYKNSFYSNKNYFKNKRLVALGVLFSFVVFEIGIQYGSYKLHLNNKRTSL